MPPQDAKWNLLRRVVIDLIMDTPKPKEAQPTMSMIKKQSEAERTSQILLPELFKEIREEIKEEAESYVIAKCKESYRHLLKTGPFSTKADRSGGEDAYMQSAEESKKPVKKHDNDIIKDRERNVVMGAILHQIDANNQVVTVAVVDKYGELIQTRDFMRLLPPRRRQ